MLVEAVVRGTHTGPLRGLPPTGRTFEMPILASFMFDGEGLVCERVYFDSATTLRQLGVARDPLEPHRAGGHAAQPPADDRPRPDPPDQRPLAPGPGCTLLRSATWGLRGCYGLGHVVKRARGRPRFVAAVAALLLVSALAAGHAARQASAASSKPNVVVILTDDQTYEDLYETTGRNGRGKKLMPKVRGLIGGQGVTFNRYYSSNPISCPSRTTNLTGQYSKNHGNTRNTFGRGKYCSDPGRVDFTHTLPAWLQAAGYRTIHYGRFLNAFGLGRANRVPEGWDDYVQPVEFNSSASAVFYGTSSTSTAT